MLTFAAVDRALGRMGAGSVYLMAAAVPISMAATSVSKLLMIAIGLVTLVVSIARQHMLLPLNTFGTVKVTLLMLAALSLGIVHTEATLPNAFADLGKYGKLLILPMALILLRSRKACFNAFAILLVSQTFVLLSSYALGMGLSLPWVNHRTDAITTVFGGGAVFSSYLDQGIMTAGYAAMCWHLRGSFPGRWGQKVAIGLAVLAFLNVMVLLPGRSGQLAMVAVVALGCWWALPKQKKIYFLVLPVILLTLTATIPTEFKHRMSLAVSESLDYAKQGDKTTSTGIRLNFWHRSVQAIAEKPWIGHGTSSWSRQYLRFEGPQADLGGNQRSNPHQEYLQWGVQLGMVGIGLFLAFLLQMTRDARNFDMSIRHATQSTVAVLAVACMFNSSLYDALIGDYFCVALGMLLALGYWSSVETRKICTAGLSA